MISKELLSEVLEEYIDAVKLDSNEIIYAFRVSSCGMTPHRYMHDEGSINIYELAHKCKEWALSKGYYLHSHTKEYNDCWCIVKSLDNITQQFSCNMDTEVEAIIQSCEWLLKELNRG